jgi:hypothetical protein
MNIRAEGKFDVEANQLTVQVEFIPSSAFEHVVLKAILERNPSWDFSFQPSGDVLFGELTTSGPPKEEEPEEVPEEEFGEEMEEKPERTKPRKRKK